MSDATPPAGGHPFPPPPPPEPTQRGGCLRYGLIGCGALIALLVLLAVGGYFWFSRNEGGFEAAAREGARHGITTDEAGCLAAAGTRVTEGGGMGAAMSTGVWMRGCLEYSRETEGFCDDVPPPTAVRRTAEWRATRCGDDGACAAVLPVVQTYCTEGRPKRIAADTLDWTAARGMVEIEPAAEAPAEAEVEVEADPASRP